MLCVFKAVFCMTYTWKNSNFWRKHESLPRGQTNFWDSLTQIRWSVKSHTNEQAKPLHMTIIVPSILSGKALWLSTRRLEYKSHSQICHKKTKSKALTCIRSSIPKPLTGKALCWCALYRPKSPPTPCQPTSSQSPQTSSTGTLEDDWGRTSLAPEDTMTFPAFGDT